MKLVLPPTLTLPAVADYPPHLDGAAVDAARAAARIEPGWCLLPPRGPHEARFVARCNVDAPQLWPVLVALAALLPEPVSVVAGMKDGDVMYTPYVPRAQVFRVLDLYRDELANDALLQFGVMHQSQGRLHEVFVPPAKYLQFWGHDREAFDAVMHAHGLAEIEDLWSIDQFPLVYTALSQLRATALYTADVLDALEERLGRAR